MDVIINIDDKLIADLYKVYAGLNDPIKNDVELNTILCNSLIGGVEKLIKEIRSVT